MIGAVHALIGAAIGSLCKRRSSAFLAGVASHAVADALPHSDFPPMIEAPLLVGAMAAIAAWRGTDSPAFWGAIGAVSPDFEHALMETGIIRPEQEIFPTHFDDGKFHGRESGEKLSQLVITGAAALTIAISGSGNQAIGLLSSRHGNEEAKSNEV